MANTREIKLSEEFSDGSFIIHCDTLCAIPIGDGWLQDRGGLRRHCRATAGFKKTRVTATEAITRSLMAHDEANVDHDDLVTVMTGQYYLMHFKVDGGQTINLIQAMHADKSVHVRPRYQCGVRSDCCNPYHRMLVRKRTCEKLVYKRFIRLLENDRGLLQDARGHHKLGVSREHFERCCEKYMDIVADFAGL